MTIFPQSSCQIRRQKSTTEALLGPTTMRMYHTDILKVFNLIKQQNIIQFSTNNWLFTAHPSHLHISHLCNIFAIYSIWCCSNYVDEIGCINYKCQYNELNKYLVTTGRGFQNGTLMLANWFQPNCIALKLEEKKRSHAWYFVLVVGGVGSCQIRKYMVDI